MSDVNKIENSGGLSAQAGWKMPDPIFKKYWYWFRAPEDVAGADMVNFFGYDSIDKPGFHKKAGLTTVIDLSQSLDQTWSKMRQSFIARQIKKGERNGLVVRQDNNFKEFRKIYYNFRKNKNIPADNYKFLSRHGVLFSAYYRNKIIAGGVFAAGSGCFRAWVLASLRLDRADGRLREIYGQANRMIIWQAIQYAKDQGYKIFDLGGIDPDSKIKEQQSLTEFKEAFGGERKQTFYYFKVYSKFLKLFMKLRGYKNI